MAKGDVDAERRRRAIDALAADPNISAAARASGYERKYLHRLLKDPAFVAQVEARRAELVEDTPDAERAEIVAECVQILREIAKGPAEKTDMARIAAAKALLALYAPQKQKTVASAPAPKPEAPTRALTPEEVARDLKFA